MKTAEETLIKMIDLLLLYLDELKGYHDREHEQFPYGERVAYTECLEWIQEWEGAKENHLNFDIEKEYPLD